MLPAGVADFGQGLSVDAREVRLFVALREGVAAAAQAVLAGPPGPSEREAVAHALARVEAALRARLIALPD